MPQDYAEAARCSERSRLHRAPRVRNAVSAYLILSERAPPGSFAPAYDGRLVIRCFVGAARMGDADASSLLASYMQLMLGCRLTRELKTCNKTAKLRA